MDDTINSLRHQRDLLADALGRLLQASGVTRTGAALTGPELLLAAETAIDVANAEMDAGRECAAPLST